MLSSESFIKIFRQECLVSVRLYRQMPPGGLDYRPTPGQRSTLELLRYLSFGPYNAVRRIVIGEWNAGAATNEVTKHWPPSDFPRRMEWQGDEVARMIRAANPLDLETKTITFPWGETLLRSEGLVRYALNWAASYRMQLFLYLKAAGAKELGTPDLWRPLPDMS